MLDATRLRVLVAIARHGSVTAAAQALNYAQPSVSHHMARLEAETGAKLMERRGRGVRLTEAGMLLAERAEEILGRIDAAEAELAAHVGQRRDRVRLAAFGCALGTLVAAAASSLRAERAATEIYLTQAEPPEALRMLKAGAVDVALTYRYTGDDGELDAGLADLADGHPPADLRRRLVLHEPVYLLTPAGQGTAVGPAGDADLADLAAGRWIASGEQCGAVLASRCRRAGFTPDIAARTHDCAAVQALVAAGVGTAIVPGLALRGARHPGIAARQLDGARHQVHAVTYGAPPVPPASGHLISALIRAAGPAQPVTE